MAKTRDRENDTIKLTREAYDEMVKELEYRKTTLRDEIAQEIATARELGDLRENHAYTVAMEKKDMNESRITDLETMLKNAEVVEDTGTGNVVTMGRTVKVQNLTTKAERTVTLVGSEETQAAEPGEGKISVDSPIGKALLNSRVGDVVEIETPAGKTEYKVLKIA